MRFLALDVGGTAIKYAYAGSDGTLGPVLQAPSRTDSQPSFLHNAVRIIQENTAFDAICVAVSGQTDPRRGTLLFRYGKPPGAQQPETPFGAMIRAVTNKPIWMLNDSDAAALGEARYGAGTDVDDFICLTYGTGVGCGIVLGGQLYMGARGIAGEAGHLVTHAGGRKCGCGFRGCYERYASTTALVRMAAAKDPSLQNGRDVCAAMETDPAVRAAVRAWAREVALGLCSMAYLLNPHRFVLGGGIMEQEAVLDLVRKAYLRRIIPTFAGTEIVRAKLGNHAGLYGALAYALESLQQNKGGLEI